MGCVWQLVIKENDDDDDDDNDKSFQQQLDNNNNNLIYKVPVCRGNSVALKRVMLKEYNKLATSYIYNNK